MNVVVTIKPDWPYDEALRWMKAQALAVKEKPQSFYVACGSHRESVITWGRNSAPPQPHLMSNPDLLLRPLDRGGGLSAHEPGQLVLYPVLNLKHHGLAARSLVALMENTLMSFLLELGLKTTTRPPVAGVFHQEHKLGFIGMRIQEGISSHGLSLNLFNDAEIFKDFEPCGMKDLKVTSVCHHLLLDEPPPVYMDLLAKHFLRHLFFTTRKSEATL